MNLRDRWYAIFSFLPPPQVPNRASLAGLCRSLHAADWTFRALCGYETERSCISCWIMSIFACSRLNVQSSMWIWDWTFRALCGYAGLSSYLPLLFSEYNPPSYGGRRKDSFRCLLILSKLFSRFHMTSNTKCQTSCLTRGINTRRSLALDLYVGCTCTSLSVVTLPFIGFCEWWLQHL
jgi:hypothetical protein